MGTLAGLNRYRNQLHRQNRLRRQRDGRANHDRAFDNLSRQEINDFLGRLQEIQENRKRIKWKPEGPEEQKQSVFALRKAKSDRYEENRISPEKLLLQGRSHQLVITTEKLHRHLNGRKIYTALQGWEGICDAYEYRQDAEAEEEQSEPDYAPPGNAHDVTWPEYAETDAKGHGDASWRIFHPGGNKNRSSETIATTDWNNANAAGRIQFPLNTP